MTDDFLFMFSYHPGKRKKFYFQKLKKVVVLRFYHEFALQSEQRSKFGVRMDSDPEVYCWRQRNGIGRLQYGWPERQQQR